MQLSPMDMLIDLKIHLFKNENELLRRFLRIFVRHPDFAVSRTAAATASQECLTTPTSGQTRMKAYVAAALLAPVAPAYLDQVYTSLSVSINTHPTKVSY